MRAVWTTRAAVICLGAIVLVACAALWFWQASRQADAGPDLKSANVLLVTIDTLRVDRIGAYGNRSGLTPTLDALANDGVRFTHAWSHAPVTLPAHASILTGQLPTSHGVRNNGSFRLGPEPTTLGEILQRAGYRTAAFVGAFVLDARFGLNRGFDEYDDRYRTSGTGTSFHFAERPADEVLGAATQWITQPTPGDGRPWFAWVHLFDPHAPYQAPTAFAANREPYDAEVAWTDAALGTALDGLRRAGQLDRTLVVVTADHGESLGDHGETTHGLFAYDATLRVPLILSAPGLRPRVVSAPIGHMDILATILDFVATPSASDGRSLRAAMEGGGSTNATPIYFEALDANLTRGWAPLRGVVSDGWKYIDLPEPELYHLDTDPGERTNRIAREPARVRELQSRLRKWAAGLSIEGRYVDSATAARLRSLGYLSTASGPRDVYTVADDPKRLVALSELFNDALDDFGRGRTEDAIAKFSKVLAGRPDFLAARLSAATALVSSSRAADAARLLRGASSNDQEAAQWQTKMGQALAAAGDLGGARTMLESAVKVAGGDSEPLNDLGVVLLRLGQRDEARRTFEQLLALDATATGTWYNLGLLEMDAQRLTAAAAAFGRVVELDPRHADGWRGLGAAVVAHDTARAVAAWQRVMELDPQDFDTLYNLGMTLADAGRRKEAATYLRRFLAEAPRDRYAQDLPRVRAMLARLDNPS